MPHKTASRTREIPMPSLKTRSDISAVEFVVYDRALHPEVVVPVEQKTERHGGAELTVEITESGHRLQWSCGGASLTELVGTPCVRLTKYGLAARHLVVNGRDVEHSLKSGFGYYAASHAEAVDADIFAQLDRELTLESRGATLSHRFGTGNRLEASAQSVITMDLMDDSLVVHAVHTFPEALTIVRTQSLFELP